MDNSIDSEKAAGPLVVHGVEGLRSLVGQFVGYSEWLQIDQDTVDQFAEATGAHQLIDPDQTRAETESPLGGTIANGFFTLSLGPVLMPTIMQVEGFAMGVNYGCNEVRFTDPVRVGSRLRLGLTVLSLADIPNGVQIVQRVEFEMEGSDRPVCVAEVVGRRYFGSSDR